MASAELIVDVHHHYMPATLFDRLAAQAGGRRIVTNEISLTLHPSRKDLEAHLQVMDEARVTVSIVTDQVQVLGAEVAKLLNDGIAEAERKHPTRFRGCIHLPSHEPEAAKRELERGINELGLRAVALLACHLDVQLEGSDTDWTARVVETDTAAKEFPEVSVVKVSGGATFAFEPRKSLPLTVVRRLGRSNLSVVSSLNHVRDLAVVTSS